MCKALIISVPFGLRHPQPIFSYLLKVESNYKANDIHANSKMREIVYSQAEQSRNHADFKFTMSSQINTE